MKAPRNPLAAFLKKPRKQGNNKFILTEDQLLSTDGSSASTHSVGFVAPLKAPLHTTPKKHQKRTVRFAEEHNSFHEYSFLNDGDDNASFLIDAAWYTPEEMEQMKKANSFIIQTIRRSAQAVPSSQDKLETYSGVLGVMYEQQQQGSCCNEELLDAWHAQQGLWLARHGLEHKLTKSVCVGRTYRRHELARCIRELASDPRELAQRCAMLTEPAAWFARAIAQ